MYLKDERREWIVVVVSEEREIFFKKLIFNEIFCKIDNLTCDVLKNEYIK